jgi:hypothetical protein
MHLAFDIFQGIGVAAAIGVRPFLPALAVGALAAGDVQIHFKHTDYSFLQGAPFLVGMAAAALALALVQRRLGSEERPVALVLAPPAAVLGALEFAGSLARGHYVVWPGLIGGVVCAGIGIAATLPLVRRVRARLDQSTAATLPAYSEAAALLCAVVSVVAPPAGVLVLVGFLWLLIAGRGREDQKYAGLRILR